MPAAACDLDVAAELGPHPFCNRVVIVDVVHVRVAERVDVDGVVPAEGGAGVEVLLFAVFGVSAVGMGV